MPVSLNVTSTRQTEEREPSHCAFKVMPARRVSKILFSRKYFSPRCKLAPPMRLRMCCSVIAGIEVMVISSACSFHFIDISYHGRLALTDTVQIEPCLIY